jgi:hypothetical protein
MKPKKQAAFELDPNQASWRSISAFGHLHLWAKRGHWATTMSVR